MKTRILYTKFYQDSYVRKLSPTDRFLFLYLITNSNIGLSDIYEADISLISFETGLTQSQIEKSMAKFQEDGKFIYYDGWIRVLNYEKYNQYKGEKNDKARNAELSMIPDRVSKYFDRVSIGYPEVGDTSINHKSEIINHKSKTINHKSEKKEKEKFEIEQVLNEWNFNMGTKYKSSKSFEDNFRYWRDEYTLEEILSAIKAIPNHKFWADKMKPDTLFRTKNKNGSCDYIADLLQESKLKINSKIGVV